MKTKNINDHPDFIQIREDAEKLHKKLFEFKHIESMVEQTLSISCLMPFSYDVD